MPLLRWTLVSKKQMYTKGEPDGIQLIFKSGSNKIEYTVFSNFKRYKINSKYEQNLDFEKLPDQTSIEAVVKKSKKKKESKDEKQN